MKNKILFGIVMLICFVGMGQEDSLSTLPAVKDPGMPTINTDRPTNSFSSYLVPARTLQLETGIIYENTKEPELNTQSWMLGTTVLRYGVWKNFEVRLGSFYQTDSYEIPNQETPQDSTYSGMGPLMVGFKVHVVEEKGIRPEIAIVAEATLRHVGAEEYHPTFSYPIAKLAATHNLAEGLQLIYNAGFGYNGENADGFFLYSGLLAYSPIPWMALFGEVYGTFDNGNLPNHRIDGGFVFLARNNLQLDVSAGMGFDKEIDKYFVSTGLSWRIPR